MNTVGVVTGHAVARSGIELLARIVGKTGALITQATISAIAYQVRDVDLKNSGTLTAAVVASTVFDTLQTSAAWEADKTGYNFALTIPATAIAWTPELDAAGNPKIRRFRVDVRFTPTSGQPFVVPFALSVQPTWIEGSP